MNGHFHRKTVILAFSAAVLAIVAYSNALHGPFTFDDRPEILDNPSIEQLAQPLSVLRHNVTRPVVNVSYAVDYAVWGGRDVVGFHLTNVVLHVLNVLLLFIVVRQLAAGSMPGNRTPDALTGTAGETNATILAGVAAGLFAVHPIQTEAVSYVASRSELLVTLFFLAGLYSFFRALSGRRPWIAMALGCFVLAGASKETGGMLPFVVFFADVLLRPRGEWRARLWKLHAPLMLLVVAGGVGRAWLYAAVENPATLGFAWGSVAVTAWSWVRYLTLLLVPYPQSVVQAIAPVTSLRDPRLIVAAFTLAALGVVTIAARRRAPLITFGLLWFALTLLPSSVMILLAQVGLTMAEHRLYLPNCGFCLAVAAVVQRAFDPAAATAIRRTAAAGIAVVLVAFTLMTLARNRVWADPVRLWGEAAERAPRSPEAALSLAIAQKNAGDGRSAEDAFNRAIALGPRLPAPYLGYADSLAESGEFARAAVVLRLASVRLPRDVKVRLMLAAIEERLGDAESAAAICREVLGIQSGVTEAEACVQRNARRGS